MEQTHIIVTRAFRIGGVTQEVGSTLDVDRITASELISYGKAARHVRSEDAPKRGRGRE